MKIVVAALVVILVPAATVGVMWMTLDPAAVVEEIESRPEPGPTDGQGQAYLRQDLLPANTEGNTIELVYRAGDDGIATGGGIQFYLPGQVVDYPSGARIEPPILDNWWLTLNPTMYTGGFYSVSAPDGVKAVFEDATFWKVFRVYGSFMKSMKSGEPVMNMKTANQEISRVRVKLTEGELARGDEIIVSIGAGGQLKTPHYPAYIDIAVETDGDGDGSYALIDNSPMVRTRCEARAIDVIAPSTPRPGESFEIAIQSDCVDIYEEPDPLYETTFRIESNGLELPAHAEIKKGDLGRTSIEAKARGEGVFWVKALDVRSNYEAVSNPIIVREKGMRLYWGDLHRHSILGDGAWKPKTVYMHARDIEHLDFVSISEHDLNQVTYYMVKDHDLTRVPDVRHREGKWEYLESVAREFNAPGRFVTLAGYEWTSHELGHRNIYFSPGMETEYPNHIDPPTDTADGILGHFENRDVVIIPHHPAWRGGEEMKDVIDWGSKEFSRQKLVEVYSQHGCSEYYRNPYPIHGDSIMFLALPRGLDDDGNPDKEVPWYIPIKGYQPTDASPPGNGNYVQEALADGRKLTLIAGSDAHFMSHYKMSYRNGLMGAWAPELTSSAIWNAMDSRLVYGTTGARIFVEFFVNGKPMGSDMKVSSPPDLTGRVIGTAPLEKVEIVRYADGRYDVVMSKEPNETEVELGFKIRSFSGTGFYYVRVTQADGHIAWAGPTWVTFTDET